MKVRVGSRKQADFDPIAGLVGLFGRGKNYPVKHINMDTVLRQVREQKDVDERLVRQAMKEQLRSIPSTSSLDTVLENLRKPFNLPDQRY